MKEVFLGNGNNLNIQTSQIVELKETLVLLDTVTGENEAIELNVSITADFSTIPEKYHEVFLNMMTAKYYNRTSFSHNPFSQCLSTKKKHWYQFWR
jgi:spore coat protein CotF